MTVPPPVTVILPVREEKVGFGSTLKATEPLPVPEAPDVMVIHETLLCAAHEQLLLVALTASVPVVPAGPMCSVAGKTVNESTVSRNGAEISAPQEFETMKS